jgi:hypothetical protein
MTHLSETLLQAYLDEEITPAVTEEVERHLASCAICRASAEELTQLTARLSEVVRQVDLAEPAEWSAAPSTPTAWREKAARRPVRHVRRVSRRSIVRDGVTRAKAPVWQWAAIILVSVAGIASAAVVVVPWIRNGPPVASPPRDIEPSAPVGPASALSDAGAIAVAPTNGEMSVALSDAGKGSRVFVRLADRMDVFVSLQADSMQSDPALFRTGDGRVEVGLANRVMMVYVEFPRALRSGRVLVGDQVIARVANGRVDPPGATERGVTVVPPE